MGTSIYDTGGLSIFGKYMKGVTLDTCVVATSLDMNGLELILDADADTSITADTDDQIDIRISAADDFRFVANIFRALSGSVIETNTINETTAASGVTIDSVVLKDGGITITEKMVAGSFGTPLDVTATRKYGYEIHYSGNNYDVTAIRARAQLVTTDATGTAQGAEIQAANNDGINAGVLNGAIIEAIGKSTTTAATISTMRALIVNSEWSAKDTVTDLRTLHVRTHTRDNATEGYFSTSGYLVYLENEAVGGNGQALTAGIYFKGTNLSGNDFAVLGIDMSGATITTADIKLHHGTTILDEASSVTIAASGTIKIQASGDTDDYLTIGTNAENVVTLYGTGAYLRIGDAGTTSHSFTSEDDLMVSGNLEVDGAIYLDGNLTVAGTNVSFTNAIYCRGLYIGRNTNTLSVLLGGNITLRTEVTGTPSTDMQVQLKVDDDVVFAAQGTGDGAGDVTSSSLKAMLYFNMEVADTKAINTGVADDDYFTIGAVANTPNTITELVRFVGADIPYTRFSNLVHFGVDDTGIDVKFFGATSGCSALWDESEDQFVITQTNVATSGVERTLDISQTHTGIGASAEALRATITTNTKGGSYMNAVFGKIDFATTGLVSGLAGVVCAELTMPGGAVAGGAGTYATFESEINLPTSYSGTVPISVMYVNTWGAQKADFDTYGYLFDINGVASGSGKFWYDATNGTTDDWIRCRINGVVKYIMLSDVQTEA